MKWFSSDLHLHHRNIIQYCNRPFMDVTHMYNVLAANWDAVVKDSDEIYILGDLGFNFDVVDQFLCDRPGRKFWCFGNHDPDGPKRASLTRHFLRVGDILETKDLATGDKIIMCHYPMARWNKGHYGSWMLHGHCHGSPVNEMNGFRILDVGVDAWNYAPVCLDTVRSIMLSREVKNNHHEEMNEGGDD